MKEIDPKNAQQILGGITIGQASAATVGGFIAGGPAGLGIAVGGVLVAHGIDKLIELFKENEEAAVSKTEPPPKTL